MATASCPRCGASIAWERVEGREEKVALDLIPQITGPHRYRIKDFINRIHEPVSEKVQVSAYPDHNYTCPARQRERERY